ncbi:uncharacterized oxidoreductase SERP2049-like [Zerene cesonia]|uniref:uncharacterized oxidoreductase SERP2049-like n=1 Tax=Zerene cesonia TaxID=33412 RepID=UPI0018E50313|nr:uncharacterized oxidoreductase SERP2049-like [Zerene cesonia]
MDFKDKVVLITGASSGLGAAIAVHMSQLSAKLVLVGRNEKNLKAVAEQCEKSKGIKAHPVIADVAKEADVERIVNETINHFGKLDVLVNNAGVTEVGGIRDTTLAKYDRIMSINIRGVLQLTMLAVPHLIKTKGNIVNISSIASTKAFVGLTDAEVEAFNKEVLETTPLKKLTETNDIAVMVAFLASDCAKSITGCTHCIDGGKTLS